MLSNISALIPPGAGLSKAQPDSTEAVSREFQAIIYKMMLQMGQSSLTHTKKTDAQFQPINELMNDQFAQQLAAQNSLGFGELLLTKQGSFKGGSDA